MTREFTKAFKAVPMCCNGFDAMHQTTVADLVFMVQHEIDLYEEGDETDIRNGRDLKACRRFVARFTEVTA